MKRWTVLFKGNTSSFAQTFEAKYYSKSPDVIVLHDGSAEQPVAIISIENIYYIRAEEELR